MKKCNNCKTQNTETQKVPFVAVESEALRQHKIIKWLILVIVLLIVLLFGSNLAWTIYNNQFETVKETYDIEVEQDTERGNNNCIVNGGEINNGETESKN